MRFTSLPFLAFSIRRSCHLLIQVEGNDITLSGRGGRSGGRGCPTGVRMRLVAEQELSAVSVCEGPESACFFPFALVNLGEEGPQLRQAVAGVMLAGHNFLSIGEQTCRADCDSVCTGLQYLALGVGSPYRYHES